MHPLIKELKEIVDLNRNLSPITLNILLKEHLQNYVLDFIYESPKYKDIIFYRGTCLKKVYNLDRMSEDLDFESHKPFDFEGFATDLEKHFRTKLKFDGLDIKIQKGEIIKRATLKFEILFALGLSEYPNEKLHLKVEVNDQAKTLGKTVISPLAISKFTMLVKHYDLKTLFSSKILAVLNRNFRIGDSDISIKGRDFYDLIWYMQKSVEPDITFIKAKTEYKDITEVFKAIDDKVKDIDSADLLADLEPFFARQGYIKDWCLNFHDFYKRYRENY